MTHRDYDTAAAQLVDTHEAVREYRGHAAALRRLTLSCPTRNAGATWRAIAWRTDRLRTIELSLVIAGHSPLVGALTDEAKLVERLRGAAERGMERPELNVRLSNCRRSIRILAG